MHEPLMLRRLAIIPTLRCTLRCKLCSNYIPLFKDSAHVPLQEIIRDLDRMFQLIDHTEWLQYVGGEIFMRHDLWELYEHSLKYKDRFDKLILITNGTVLPCPKDIDVLKKYGAALQIQISDYGKYSYKHDKLVELLSSNNLPYVSKTYHGNIQHYGGWVDNTTFVDRDKSDKDLKTQFDHCGQVTMRNFHLYRGKLHGCARSLLASTLNKITPAQRDFIDLYNHTVSDHEKREIIRHFNDSPRTSCRSCISFGENVTRYPAAEQL